MGSRCTTVQPGASQLHSSKIFRKAKQKNHNQDHNMASHGCLLLGLLAGAAQTEIASYSLPSPWSYECDTSNSSYTTTGHFIPAKCVKVPSSSSEKVQGLQACKMTCGSKGTLWPAPTGLVQLSSDLVNFIPQNFRVVSVSAPSEDVSNMINQFADVFKEYLFMMNPDYEGGYKNPFTETPFINGKTVQVSISVENEDLTLDTETDETYSIAIQRMSANELSKRNPADSCDPQKATKRPATKGKPEEAQGIHITISGKTYYGARHGLETLSQMISYDDLSDTLQTYSTAFVEDEPSFKHRGLLLDTSRNFMSKKVIKNIISGMSYDKLNVFHWHITDTHSFPFYSRRVPQLSLHGAYSPKKAYKPEDIREIVEFAKLRGVRVLPEFDAPAHVGNGWQFGGERANIVRRGDNLQPEGDFAKRPDAKWAPGERANVIKRDDNLHPEGEFTKRPDGTWAPGERANIVRRDDNLQPEGDFAKRPDAKWAPGERANVIRRDDNLHSE